MFIISIILRLVLLVLYVSDIMLTRKMKKRDNTLKRYLSKPQEFCKFGFHFIVMAGLLLPFEAIFIVVTLAVIVFFFIFTDKEIYSNMHSMYFRDKYYEFKKVKNFSYINNTLEFDYNNEHVRLKNPFLAPEYIQHEIVHRIEKSIAKQDAKQKRNTKGR